MSADQSPKIVIVDESPIRAAILQEGLREAGFTAVEHIREMQNLIERAVILSSGRVLCIPLEDLRPAVTRDLEAPGLHRSLADAERAHILAVLKETRCVLSGPRGAANRLGMNRSTLQFRMKKLGISRRVVMDCTEEVRR